MKKFAIFDTETNGVNNPYIYDIAWQIVDKKGNVYESENFAIRETITDPAIMCQAYYHKKVYTDYIEMLAGGMLELVNYNFAMAKFNRQIKEHNVKVISAYNLGFDLRALKATNMLINKIPAANISKKLERLDIWQFACETFLNSRTFKKEAFRNAWISDKGNIQTGAEIAYKYLTGNPDFIEDHTALSDVEIERDILTKCFQYQKKIPYGIVNAHPWRIVNS